MLHTPAAIQHDVCHVRSPSCKRPYTHVGEVKNIYIYVCTCPKTHSAVGVVLAANVLEQEQDVTGQILSLKICETKLVDFGLR